MDLWGFFTFCSSSHSPFSPWKGLCPLAAMWSVITVSHGNRSDWLESGHTLWRDTAGRLSSLLSFPPARTWQGEKGNTEAVRASLTELSFLCRSLCMLPRTRQPRGWVPGGGAYLSQWVMCRLSGGSGNGSKEGIDFDTALAGRKGNKMGKRSGCRLQPVVKGHRIVHSENEMWRVFFFFWWDEEG